MSDTRRVSRRESITVIIERLDDLVFEINPLPWRVRNDFGDEVLQQYLGALNKVLEERKIGEETRIVSRLIESSIDYAKLYSLAVPEGSPEDFAKLDYIEIIEVLGAALEVNGLSRQRYMLDPNLPTPTENTGSESGSPEDGQKITLLPDSLSPELLSEISTDSPMEKS